MRNILFVLFFLVMAQFATSGCATSRQQHLNNHQEQVQNQWLEKKTFLRGIASEETEEKGKYYYGK